MPAAPGSGAVRIAPTGPVSHPIPTIPGTRAPKVVKATLRNLKFLKVAFTNLNAPNRQLSKAMHST